MFQNKNSGFQINKKTELKKVIKILTKPRNKIKSSVLNYMNRSGQFRRFFLEVYVQSS